MSFVDNNFDFLLNIETAIINVYREQRDILDYDVMRVLDALIERYRYVFKGFVPKDVVLNENETRIYESVEEVCELMIKPPDNPENTTANKPDTAKVEKLIACLRKIRKSADFWNKEGGRQGYLKYVDNFIQ